MIERDDYLVDAIICHKELAEQGQALALAEDGIRIALKIAGCENVDSMNQFERASALLNMAQELAALTDKRHATMHFETATNRKVEVWERLYVRSWEQTLRGNPA